MRLATTREMKELDHRAIEDVGIPSIDLMDRAAEGVAQAALTLLPEEKGTYRAAALSQGSKE